MKPITCIEDLRGLARRRVPKAFFEYADAGSYNEETLRANRADLERIKLRQRVMVDVSQRSLATTIIGQQVNAPIALVLTVDLQVLGQRHRDLRNGMTVPPEIRLRNVIDIATKPAWAFSILRSKSKNFGNLAGHVKGMEDVTSLAQWTNEQFDPALNWKDVEWIKKVWPGKLIIKGILDVEDAKTAAKLGADAIVVSNPGG